MLILGISIFIMEPWYRELDTTGIPLVFANYLSKSNGSIFTILPCLDTCRQEPLLRLYFIDM